MTDKCKTCKYRGKSYNLSFCDYINITREPRGCSVEECDKYVKGKHHVQEVQFLIPKEY